MLRFTRTISLAALLVAGFNTMAFAQAAGAGGAGAGVSGSGSAGSRGAGAASGAAAGGITAGAVGVGAAAAAGAAIAVQATDITPAEIAAACAESDAACDAIIARKIAQLEAPGRGLTPAQIDAELAKVALAVTELVSAPTTPTAPGAPVVRTVSPTVTAALRTRIATNLVKIEQAAKTPVFKAIVTQVATAVTNNQTFQTAALQQQASGN